MQHVDDTSSKIIDTGQNKTLRLAFKAAQLSGRVIFNAIKKYMANRKDVTDHHGEMDIKKLIQKEGQMQQMDVSNKDIKEFRKELKKMGVDFSITKRTLNPDEREELKNTLPEGSDIPKSEYSLWFKAKDLEVIDKSFKEYIAKHENKESIKEQVKQSVREKLDKFKEMIPLINRKDKEKHMNRGDLSL